MDRDREILSAAKRFDRIKPDAVKHRGVIRNASKRTATQESLALSCHPSQVKEFNDNARRAGLTNVHYEKDGTCIMPSFGKQRKGLLKLRGVIDRGEMY